MSGRARLSGGRIRAVMRREIRDYRRNRFVIITMLALPLFFLFIPITAVLALNADASDAAIRSTVGSAGLLFLLVPLILPTVIAASAVIGERDQGTLEPVLTTPVLPEELVLGKASAAVIPTVAIAYALMVAYAIAVRARDVAPVVAEVSRPGHVVVALLFTPLLALFSIWVGLAISVRSNDIRVAQQLSGLAMLPMIALLSLFTFGVLSPSVPIALGGAALLVAIDASAWRVVSRMFDRERLLTRYGRT